MAPQPRGRRRPCRPARAWLAPILLSTVVVINTSCGDSPTPTTPDAPSSPTVNQLTVTGLAPAAGQTSQMTAMAALSDGSTQNVTAQATWGSSDVNVATVSSTGVVLGLAAGSTDITALYQGRNASIRLQVIVPRHRLSGLVTDARAGYVLADAEVRVTDGPNLGMVARTDSAGHYAIVDLLQGTMTLRATARQSTWSSLERTLTLSTDSDLDFALPRASEPDPGPPPAPPPSFGTGAFIYVVTNSETCSCSEGTIRVNANGRRLGTTNCKTDERRFEVGPGSYTIRACDDLGCWDDLDLDLEEGEGWELLLTCSTPNRVRRIFRSAVSPVSEWLLDALSPYLPRTLAASFQYCVWTSMPRSSRVPRSESGG